MRRMPDLHSRMAVCVGAIWIRRQDGPIAWPRRVARIKPTSHLLRRAVVTNYTLSRRVGAAARRSPKLAIQPQQKTHDSRGTAPVKIAGTRCSRNRLLRLLLFWLALPFLDFDLLHLARHLQWLREVDAQYAVVEPGLDLARIGIERQGDLAAERAIGAFRQMPAFVLVLLVALRLFLTADSQH